MKKMRYALMAIMASATLWVAPVVSVGLVGCSGCSTVEQGQDVVVVRAEQLYQDAFRTFKSFAEFELGNRAYLNSINPSIEKMANTIRSDGMNGVEALKNATMTYKQNRTSENKANLDTWIASITQMQSDVARYLSESKPK